MRFSAYIIFMLCITLVLYFMGFQGMGLTDAMGQPLSISSIIPNIITNLFAPNGSGIVNLVVSIVGGTIIAALSGFSAIYIVPLAMIMLTLNYFILPTSFLYNGACAAGVQCVSLIPGPLKLPLFLLFNTLLVLSILDFTRGGG
jgi:hypothetical protein